MSFQDLPEPRVEICSKLGVYMAGPPRRGAVAVANDIGRNAHVLGGTVSHDTIKRCVNGEECRPGSLEILYNFLALRGQIFDPDVHFPEQGADQVFRLIEHFFGVADNNRVLCTLLDGNYSVFFHSEDINESVVVGALEFSRNQATRAFEIKELQSSKRPRRIEKWNGYFFARRERIIMVLRGEGPILRETPKFYVLNTPHADETENGALVVSEIGGTMLKLGSGGRHTGAFSAKVLLRRDPKAFDKCDVLPVSQIDADILREI
jgi:hypothetical protein